MIISAPNHEPGECWAARHRAHIAEADARRAAERDSQRHSSVLRAARVVDVYHDGGVRERFIYRVTESLTDGCLDAVRLQRGRVEVAVISVASAKELRTRAWPLIREALGADLERFSRGLRGEALRRRMAGRVERMRAAGPTAASSRHDG